LNKLKPYQAAVVMTGEGAITKGGYFLKYYELRLFGGLCTAQSVRSRRGKPIVLARRTHGCPIQKGPKWMHQLAEQINQLNAYNPEQLLAFLNMQPQTIEGQKNRMTILSPTLKELGGFIDNIDIE
jgi:hypothetical protein